MSYEQRKMQPWQVFHAARKALGANVVARVFNREIRSANNWAQDPAYTVCRCKSPLELLHTLFERMDSVGLGYVARAGIRYLESAIDDEVDIVRIKEPLPTITEEILADYGAVSVLQAAIDAGEPLEVVKIKACAAKEEIERTVAKYAQGQQR